MMSDYQIEISDQRDLQFIDHQFLKQAICRVLSEEGVKEARISVAIVGDSQIHDVNRQFLGHDYPTDVISFRLDTQTADEPVLDEEYSSDSTHSSPTFDGELVVSFETAAREASSHGWSPEAEMLLYVVHGLLHLCGYDDLTDEARPVMRRRERELLAIWGFCPTGLEP
jgi:probable rRNA maturation factor